MTGLFDSGTGGFNTALEIRRLLPNESLILLADCGRAPFGEKSDREITDIAEENLRRLSAAGAERVLIACCTVSSLFDRLSEKARKTAVPIIAPTARAAERSSENRRIAVLATEATVRSHAFKKAIRSCEVSEISTPELVRLAEEQSPESIWANEVIGRLADRIAETGADTLVLGCTHFHSLADRIARETEKHGIKKIISSAREGAGELYRILKTR